MRTASRRAVVCPARRKDHKKIEQCQAQIPRNFTFHAEGMGGGYARLLPAPLLRYLFRTEANRRATWPIFYTHPYEIDPHEFKRSSPPPPWGSTRLPWKLRLHQGLGRGGFAAKLRLLMKDFRFRSFADVMETKPSFGEICADDFAQENAPRRS